MSVIIECWTARRVSLKLTRLLVSSLLILPLIVGCGNENRVGGQVTLDGKPVARGSILFVPAKRGQGKAVAGKITDGSYRLSGDAAPKIGWYRVEIRSSRKTGKMVQKPYSPKGDMMEASEEAIAAKYNDNSALEFEMKPGENRVNWEVESR